MNRHRERETGRVVFSERILLNISGVSDVGPCTQEQERESPDTKLKN